jgi:UDP-N-acetylmuramate dehydrogenase
MVLDAADHDTWSAGSFFTHPVLAGLPAPLAHLPADHPAVWSAAAEPARGGGAGASARVSARESVGAAAPDSGVKISAGWLIRQAGFEPGFALPGSSAGLSTKHVLALTNRGGATGAQIRELADHVAAAVEAAFGVALRPEPILL